MRRKPKATPAKVLARAKARRPGPKRKPAPPRGPTPLRHLVRNGLAVEAAMTRRLIRADEESSLVRWARAVVNGELREAAAPPAVNAAPPPAVGPAPLIVVNGDYEYDLRHLHDYPEARDLYHAASGMVRNAVVAGPAPYGFLPDQARAAAAAFLAAARDYVADVNRIREAIPR